MKQGSDLYWDNLTRNYGNYSNGINDKGNWIKSDFKFEELNVGMTIIHNRSKQESTIIGLTSNTVNVYITADKRSVDSKNKSFDEFYEDVVKGKSKGISSSNWFNLEEFNRTFKRK